ncbi:MAG: BatA and WFA domain-containing protein [Bacteroidetes bacterium]|nr:BatA and WFA domain-containing protein [Bacteroidota bacterium]
MQFLFPWFLTALVALAIPVIIHLFNFRRFKTVYFSNVKFLKEVKEETASRSKLKHLLVLAARLLALAFLVFAFAQPFISNKKNQFAAGKKNVSIYIDNSFSVNAIQDGRSLFDKAKATAKEIVKSYAADDAFQLLSNDFEGRHQRLVNKEEFTAMIDELEISPAVRSMQEITKRQQEMLNRNNEKNKTAYLLTDFQKNMSDWSVDSSISYNLIPLSADVQNNLFIDSVWFAEPVQLIGQNVTLVVKLTNSGGEKTDGKRLALKLNGQTKTMSELSIEPASSVTDTLRFLVTQPGWNKVELTISDYPITYDDNYYVAFKAIEKVNVLSVSGNRSNPFLDAMFSYQPEFSYRTVSESGLPSDSLQGIQLLVLSDLKNISSTLTATINGYVSAGGTVALFPAAQCDMESYNRLLNSLQANSMTGFSVQQQDLATINLQQNIFSDVFEKIPDNLQLPLAKQYYTFSRGTTSREEPILTLKDGSSFLSHYPSGKGSVYVAAVPLNKDFSELPVHAIFVPMIYKMALQAVQVSNIAYFIGSKTRIEIEGTGKVSEQAIKIFGDQVEFIPEQYAVGGKMLLGLSEQINQAGFYTIGLDKPTATDLLALNFDRRESLLDFYSAADLKEKYALRNVQVVDGAKAEVAAVVKELDKGTPLWKICLILTLVFLAIEIALLRFWKV